MTFDRAENGDLVFTAVLTVRRHWRLFSAVTLPFLLYALWIPLSPSDLAEAQARIKVHENYVLIAIDAARSRGVAPTERKWDKTILLVAVASEPATALAQINEAISAIEIDVREPSRAAIEELEAQAWLIGRELQALRLELVGIQAMDTVVDPWNNNGADRLETLADSVEKLNKAVEIVGSRANTDVHLTEEARVVSFSRKPQAVAKVAAAWAICSLTIGLGLHIWQGLKSTWKMAGDKI